MFIDKTYFVGPLTIAQLGQPAVEDDLNNFIALWEPKILEAALGYDFYQAFLEGLNVGSDEQPEQRWLDLLNGVSFANVSGTKRKWVGFAGGDNVQTVVSAQRPNLTIYAGITPGFAQDDYKYSNSGLATWNYDLELFGAGTLEYGVDWEYKAGGGFVLKDTSYQTAYNERWILHFTGKKTVTVDSGNQNLVSPLAGFIFYEYMVNLTTQNTGIGVVKSESENSIVYSPARKMADAYNQAVKDMLILWEFLQVKTQATPNVYPEFDLVQIDANGYFGWYDNSLYSFNYINPLF
jgi:hypothetical protein